MRASAPEPDRDGRRRVYLSAAALVIGILLSGPVAMLVVESIHPQPSWQGPATFAAEFHRIQIVPYVGGFILLAACVALVSNLVAIAPPERKARAYAALVATAAFVALILLNYIIQSTFIPALVHPYRPEHAALITGLTMANPASLAWALEMWGYAVLGVATWAISYVFHDAGIERATRTAYVANGVVSIVGAVAMLVSPSWVQSPAGIAAFALWNALMIAMGVLTMVAMRRPGRMAKILRPLPLITQPIR